MMRLHPPRKPINVKPLQGGQGLFEFIVAVTLLLVPFVLGIAYLSRVGDLKHKALEASRYVTWERTVWGDGSNLYNAKSDEEINQEATLRVFGHALLPIDSVNDMNPADITQVPLDPYLRTWDQHFAPRANLLMPAIEPNQLASLDVQVTQLGLATGVPGLRSVENFVTTYLDFDKESGFYNSTLSINLYKEESWWKAWAAGLGSEFNPFTMKTNNAMLIGAWNSAGPEEVKKRVAKATIAGLPVVRDVLLQLKKIQDIPLYDKLLPELKALDLGLVVPDIIPCQRTEGGTPGTDECVAGPEIP